MADKQTLSDRSVTVRDQSIFYEEEYERIPRGTPLTAHLLTFPGSDRTLCGRVAHEVRMVNDDVWRHLPKIQRQCKVCRRSNARLGGWN